MPSDMTEECHTLLSVNPPEFELPIQTRPSNIKKGFLESFEAYESSECK